MSDEDIIANLTKKLEQAEADKAELLDALNSVISVIVIPGQLIISKVRKVLEKYSHE
ncbi:MULTISPECIES: hypothetical protein [Vibrio]|uniref:hypothetical protein n=1 Tax=Vibrio TaxID=662 RepID=UPI002094C225|nr:MULTISPECIES: hypothetical protein [Vibrio]MCO7020934.1 hypothetical protein [Vibrio paracholerae]MCX9579811.1 hypothetical protein [Vibrio cholerae]